MSETPNKPDDKGAGGATTVNLEDLQRRLTESEARNKKLEERLDASEKRAQEAESRERKERDARVLESALTDSGLPEASITRLREALSGKSEEDIKAGIDAEKKYAESFGWKPGESSTETPGKETKVTGAGPERKTESGGKGAGDPSEAEQCEQEFMESMGRDIGFYDDDAKRFVGAETTTEKAGA